MLKYVKKLDMRFQKFNLKCEIGTEDVILTSALIVLISSIFSYYVGVIAKNFNYKKHKYIFNPVYKNKNLLNVELNCIVNVRLFHVINMGYMMML